MSTHLHLERIDPLFLSQTVAPSGIVSSDQLATAFKAQALYLSEHVEARPPSSRIPLWRPSNKATVVSDKEAYAIKLLETPTMRSGIHKWRIRVDMACSEMDSSIDPERLALGVDSFTSIVV